MSTNCVVCVRNKRTGFDLLCDDCRVAEAQRVPAGDDSHHRVARLPRLDARSPLAKARDEWLASADGKAACDPLTLKAPADARQYLENRLVGAWIAGAAWAERKQRKGRVLPPVEYGFHTQSEALPKEGSLAAEVSDDLNYN